MTNYHGTGGRGKRLWIRSKDKRWIEIPYGAGQDKNVRSLNLYDGSQWVSPAWADTSRQLDPDTHQFVADSVEVYAPQVKWTGEFDENSPINSHYWNPNYSDTLGDDMFSPAHPNWLRLFHTRPRTDPESRIVPLFSWLPEHIPNRTVDFDTELLYFWPSYTQHTLTVIDGVSEERFDAASSFTGVGVLARAWVDDGDPTFSRGLHQFHIKRENKVGLLDLASIRKRLTDDYSEQDPDYTGQHKPITSMLCRRVYVIARVSISVTVLGTKSIEELTAIVNQVSFTLRSRGNNATRSQETEDLYCTRSYNLNFPTEIIPPSSSTVLLEVSGENLPVTYVNSDPAWMPRRQNQVQASTDTGLTGTTWTFEAPGENDIGFYPEIAKPIRQPGVDQIEAVLTVTPIAINIHYATGGHDTPEDKDPWDIG